MEEHPEARGRVVVALMFGAVHPIDLRLGLDRHGSALGNHSKRSWTSLSTQKKQAGGVPRLPDTVKMMLVTVLLT